MNFPNQLRGTFAHRLFHRMKLMSKKTANFSFDSPVGEIELTLPSNLSNVDLDDYEARFISDLQGELSDDSIFYDIGAYVGYVTKAAINCGVPANQIHSFEGVPYRYYVLQKNCEPVGVNIVNRYVGGKTSKTKISIDDYSKTNPSPDVVKIDVEGFEYEVLKGMAETINISQPTMYIEVHPKLLDELGMDENKIFQRLKKHGYELLFMQHRQGEGVWRDEPIYDESTLSPTYMLKAQS